MGTTDISGAKSAGNGMDESWYNDFRSALIGVFVGRDSSSGSVASGEDLGSPTVPWGNLYANGAVISGQVIDFTNLIGEPNAILSGRVRTTSSFPDFVRANGAAASFQILATTTNLVLNIGSTLTTVTADITESGLTVAPSSNNTATVNDSALGDEDSTLWLGEEGTVIPITSAGTEITNRIGEYVTFKKDTEYFLAYVKSATELTNCYRGYYFDSSGNPLERVSLANSDTLTLMSTGWIFVEDDATTIDVTYTTPIYSFVEPGSPATGDYWFDNQNKVWKRYSGSAFVTINRILIGIAAIDATNCVASRSLNFNKVFDSFNPIELSFLSVTEIQVVVRDFDINSYGVNVSNRGTGFIWDITTDREGSQTEDANTIYYAYITEKGEKILSKIKPYEQNSEIRGWYHPFNSWRAFGYILNNGSSNFDSTTFFSYSGLKNEIDSPIGQIITYGGTTPPHSTVACDGAAISRDVYFKLFEKIGTTWGVGDGSTTFNTPDTRRSVLVGSGGSGSGVLGNAVGDTGGSETFTQTISTLPSHTHTVTKTGDVSVEGSNDHFLDSDNQVGTVSTSSTGSGTPHTIMQPSAVVLHSIRYQ